MTAAWPRVAQEAKGAKGAKGAMRAMVTLLALLLAGHHGSAGSQALPTRTAVANVVIGGGLVHCSSMGGPAGGAHCTRPWAEILRDDPGLAGLSVDRVSFDRVLATPSFSYAIDAGRIAALQKLPAGLMPADTKAVWSARLAARLRAAPGPLTGLSQEALLDADRADRADDPAGPALRLGATERAALLHTFVEPLRPAREPRPVQARSVMFSSNTASREIYAAFVQAARQAAGGQAPLVGLVTAAAGNPYNDHDINLHALQSAGARVVWLPLEGGLRQAMAAGDCEHIPIHYSAYARQGSVKSEVHMDQVFPDLARRQREFCLQGMAGFTALAQRLNGIFFSGGDQARVLDAFVARDAQGHAVSEPLQTLRSRHAEGQLVVAGSSAGDSIQSGGLWRGRPVPMVGGGESAQTLAMGFVEGSGPTIEGAARTGIRYRTGGLGFFNFGPLDSHFSQRGREGRLVRLVHDSGLDYGFGVDENTALLVHRPDACGTTLLRVVGAGGVFIADLRAATGTGAAADRAGDYAIADVAVHYLSAGDEATIDPDGTLQVVLAPGKRLLATHAAAAPAQTDADMPAGMSPLWQAARAMGASGAAVARGRIAAVVRTGTAAAAHGFELSRGRGTRFAQSDNGFVSYTGLFLRIAPLAADAAP